LSFSTSSGENQQVDVVLRLCITCNTTTAKITLTRTLNLTKKKESKKPKALLGHCVYNGGGGASELGRQSC
jgi:hypothetical protein